MYYMFKLYTAKPLINVLKLLMYLELDSCIPLTTSHELPLQFNPIQLQSKRSDYTSRISNVPY